MGCDYSALMITTQLSVGLTPDFYYEVVYMDMGKRLKISVITAVYNRKETILQALKSVRSQSYNNVEHVIVDGMSSDGTSDIIASFRGDDLLVSRQADDGIYDALNIGIGRASGDIIGLMHSDDFFANDEVLTKIVAAFEDPDIDLVYGDLNYVDQMDQTKIVRRWVAGEFSQKKIKKGWMPPHPTVFVRRHVYQTQGLYNTVYKIASDYDAMLKWFAGGRYKVAYIPEVLVNMRVGGESNASLKKIMLKSREDYLILRKNKVGGLYSLAWKNFSKIGQFFPGLKIGL